MAAAAAACLCLITGAAFGIPALLNKNKSDFKWEGTYTALEASLSDADDGGTHSIEYDLWSSENRSSHEDKTAAT